MSPKKFNFEEREEVKIQLLEAGYQLIRTHGMTHTSVEKVTQAAGLGKGTFYNFFENKEQFVYEIIQYMRRQLLEQFEQRLHGRDKLPQAEAKEFLKQIIFSDRSIYKYLTSQDEEKLRQALPPECFLNEERETAIVNGLFNRMEGIRSDKNAHLVANLIKIMALAQINQTQLHADALEETLEKMFTLTFSCIFQQDEGK